MTRLIVEIEKIKGKCVVFKGNEKIIIEGAEIKLEETDKYAFMPYNQFCTTQ